MIIERNLNIDGTLLPNIMNLVASIPDDYLFHEKYLLRHPSIIANRSLIRVIEAFYSVIDEYDKYILEFHKTKDLMGITEKIHTTSFPQSLTELFESIISYIEDCLIIFKCATPNKDCKEVFVSKWLKKVNHPTSEQFIESIKDYRDEVSFFVNKIKHEHGLLKIIFGQYANNIQIGYCIKNVENTNNFKNEKVVMEVLDLNTAKSLISDLKYHLFHIYKISEVFTSLFLKSIIHYHSKELKINKKNSSIPKSAKVLNWLLNKNYIVFPNNEILTPKVHISFNVGVLKLEYPIGITSSNIDLVKFSNDVSEIFSTGKWLIPKTSLVKMTKIDTEKNDSIPSFTIPNEDLIIANFSNEIINEENERTVMLSVDYVGLFRIRTYLGMCFNTTLLEGIDNNGMKLPKTEIDYLGLKFPYNNDRVEQLVKMKVLAVPYKGS